MNVKKQYTPWLFAAALVFAACGGGGNNDSPDAGEDNAPDSGGGDVCTPDEFVECEDESTAVFCNGDGTDTVTEACDFGCNAATAQCNACTPDTTECQGDSLVTCDSDGAIAESTECDAGCDAEGDPNACFTLTASYLPGDLCDATPQQNLNVAAEEVKPVDTDSCNESPDDFIHEQDEGPGICVLHRADVTIAATGAIRATGSRALAIVATETMTIDGLIDVSADGQGADTPRAGPGAVLLGEGTLGADDSHGGSGAGHETAGGDGGDGAAGGDAYGMDLQVLRGGSPGGSGNGPTAIAPGGPGGGALQLVSCTTASFGDTAVLDAGGGGGAGGVESAAGNAEGGGGGGSGGAVVIEAGTVTFSGTLIANGGGGGGGGDGGAGANGDGDGDPGGDGTENGGLSGGAGGNAGAGGAGGASSAPAPGAPGGDTIDGSGGGGGAAGRILINTRPGTDAMTDGATMSPAAATGDIGQK